MGNIEFCSGCGAVFNAQPAQHQPGGPVFQQNQTGYQPQVNIMQPPQGQQGFISQESQYPQQGQQFPQPPQGPQFPQQQGQQFPQQQGPQFQPQGPQFPQQQGQQRPQQGQQFQPQEQQYQQQGPQGSPPGAPPPGAPPKKGLSKKLMIIIGAAALVVAGVVIALILLLGGNSVESEEFFDVGGDMIPSVMYVLGEKRKISEVRISGSKNADKMVVEYSVSDNQGDEMEEYAQALVDDFDFIALDEYDFGGKRGSNFQYVKVSDEDDEYIVIVTLDFNNNGYTLTIERREGEISIGPDDADFAPDGDIHEGDAVTGDEPAIDIPEGWPVDDLPPGFPVYPGGKQEYFINGANVAVSIENTDRNTFEGYLDALKAWGFDFSEPNSSGVYVGYTENWAIAIFFEDDYNHTYFGLEPDIGG